MNRVMKLLVSEGLKNDGSPVIRELQAFVEALLHGACIAFLGLAAYNASLAGIAEHLTDDDVKFLGEDDNEQAFQLVCDKMHELMQSEIDHLRREGQLAQ